MTRTLYWYGNAAKTAVIDEILTASQGRAVTVFDYGCGDGGDWPAILRDNENLSLIGYEPARASYERCRERLAGSRAEIHSGSAIESLTGPADYIVSFSVFEHVYDRPAYLRHAKRMLARGGAFYLNYDDGHFRNYVDLSHVRRSLPELRVWLHNVAQPLIAAAGVRAGYQRRVPRREADRLVGTAGFRITSSFYSNVRSLKALAQSIPPQNRQEFARFWIQSEAELNRHFLADGDERMRDTANLWTEMPSRTLRLGHAGEPRP